MMYRAIMLCLGLAAPVCAQDSGIRLQGETRMGLVWDRPDAAPGSDRADARLYARTRLRMKFLGETDGGLRFGALIDLDKSTDDDFDQRVFIGN